jgi:hypothetical protein
MSITIFYFSHIITAKVDIHVIHLMYLGEGFFVRV